MDIYKTRLARLRTRMAETGTDLVVLGPTSHMAWLSGADPHGDERPVMLLVSQSHAGFLMPALNANSVRQATDLPFEPWTDEAGPTDALGRLLEVCNISGPGKTVALDEAMRADFALLLLDAMEAPVRRFSGDTLGHLRAMKDTAEVEALRTCAHLNDAAASAGFASLRAGMTERDVATIIRDHYVAHGAKPEFTIVAFGANGAFPHHHTGDTVLHDDMAVLIDTGCRIGGYPSDMTRCGWFGSAPSAEFLRVADVVERAVQAAIAVVCPGVLAREIDAAARGVIEDAGYGDFFVHRTGHGLGLDIHEPPYITATSDTLMQAGHVFSIEPGIYLPGQFGLRLEDIVIATDTGADVLSALPRTIVTSVDGPAS
ncbi:M24 family metallopeptidase [Jannaschia sp. CCS1]|uniref:M24 family metallopeptidase n=1 Tax=Jannaschia sp. (strain CCS1) TaxID=290400 RepID=UPI000053AAA1|nr:Xaa-Pro peptidase family protein [Jannaschia sp. CCS1]ABD54965.1 peptidase M24 [Jannaschia sp. CCS1]